MGKLAVRVPITPAVLEWAIRESGYTREEIASKVGVSPEELSAWISEGSKPTLTQFKTLAGALKRTPATFLLPSPPDTAGPAVKFRRPKQVGRSKPNPDELRYLREATRLQETIRWLIQQLGKPTVPLPEYTIHSDAEIAADSCRDSVMRHLDSDRSTWPSDSRAFRSWRGAVECSGTVVLLFPMGQDSVSGFSIWDDVAPVIAVNTAWNHAARIFTLFHEYGHLLTRTNSLCIERVDLKIVRPTDPAERWCEEFAASLLLPWQEVSELLKARFQWSTGDKVRNLDVPRAISKEFRVSFRAATLRLIERGVSSWELYKRIPALSDQRTRGGRSDETRDRAVIREDQYGLQTFRLFADALNREILGAIDVLDYLDLPDTALDWMQTGASHNASPE